jgi:Protein of unknown function (DUF2892)
MRTDQCNLRDPQIIEASMRRNVGTTDRVIRAGLGVVILAFLPQTAWAWLGIIPMLTAIVGFCPLYQVLGWSTIKEAKA